MRSEAERDLIRIEASKRNCSPYLCIPLRTLAQARKEIASNDNR